MSKAPSRYQAVTHEAVLSLPPMCPMCGPSPRPHSPQHPGDQGLAPAALSAGIASRWSPLQAIIRAVLSSCAQANKKHHELLNYTSTYRPVTPTPTVSLASLSAPAANRACTTLRRPVLLAAMRGVKPICTQAAQHLAHSLIYTTPCPYFTRDPTTHIVLCLLVGARCQQGLYHLEATHTAGRNEGRETNLQSGSTALSSNSSRYPAPTSYGTPSPTSSFASLLAPAANSARTTSTWPCLLAVMRDV